MSNSFISRCFSIAPMMKWTDRHCRYFHRRLSSKILLYTEMITTGTIINGRIDRLNYNQEEHPVVLQLGGNNPSELSKCAKLAQQYGYDEINFNVGCPSNRVRKGKFGAYLMSEAELVADCIQAMSNVVNIPVTVKTRIGIDQMDDYAFLHNFIQVVAKQSGCNTFIIHARKAFLSGMNTKKNRQIPSLDYTRVYQIKRDFPALNIVLNGGISTLEEAKVHLQYLDGVMMGRAAYQNPGLLAHVDHKIFGKIDNIPINLISIVRSMYPYIESELVKGTHLYNIIKHMMGLFQGKVRRFLNENTRKPHANIKVLEHALSQIEDKNL